MDDYQIGDMVFALEIILNDGGVPGLREDAVLAEVGSRGVVVRAGHSAADPRQQVYLVRFEDAAGTLGPPVGCLDEELGSEPPAARPA